MEGTWFGKNWLENAFEGVAVRSASARLFPTTEAIRRLIAPRKTERDGEGFQLFNNQTTKDAQLLRSLATLQSDLEKICLLKQCGHDSSIFSV
jgi:hypothetical protein